MSTLLRLLVPCLLAAAALPAARADDPPRPAEPPAALSVSYQPTGRAAVQLALTGRDGPPGIRVEPLTAVLQAVVGPGAPPAEVELAPPVYAWSVRDCPLAAVGDNVAQGALDLRPLLSELAVQGYRRLHVTVTFPGREYHTGWLGGRPLWPTPRQPPGRFTSYEADLPTDADNPVLSVVYMTDELVLDFSLPDGPADPRWLWLLAAVPLGAVLPAWRLRRLAARPAADAVALGFRYWRFENFLVVGAWVAWMAAAAFSGAGPLLAGWLDGPGTPARAARWGLLYVLPPCAIALLAQAVVAPAGRRLAELGWPLIGLTRRAVGLQMVAAAATLLSGLALAALIHDGAARTGVLLALAAIAVLIACHRLTRHALQLTPLPLAHGELRDRVTALAAHFGVAVPQVGLLPTDRTQLVNAFAVAGKGVWLTDRLVAQFSRREVDAIVAHELAHLRQFANRRRPGGSPLIRFAVLTTIILALWIGFTLRHRLGLGWPVWLPVPDWVALGLAGLVLYLQYATSAAARRREFDADRGSAEATGDAPALITALTRLNRLSGLPDAWGRWAGLRLTHPSTERRVLALARQGGLTPAQLADLRANAEPTPDRYPVPPSAVAAGLVFSPAFRQRVSGRLTWAVLLLSIALPIAAALLAQAAGPGAPARVILVAGAAAAPLAYLLAVNVLACAGGAALRRGVRAKLLAEGIDPGAAPFVSYAPAAEPLLYEGFGQWDVGFLIVGDGRLSFAGEQARFTLPREQVTDVRLGRGLPNWLPTRRAYVTWRDAAGGAEGTFAVWPGDAHSMLDLRRRVEGLVQRLRAWREGGAPGEPAPPDFGAPALATVHGTAPRGAVRPRAWLASLLVVELLAVALCVLAGLPFWSTPLGGTRYVFAVVAGAFAFQALPYWLARGTAKGVVLGTVGGDGARAERQPDSTEAAPRFADVDLNTGAGDPTSEAAADPVNGSAAASRHPATSS